MPPSDDSKAPKDGVVPEPLGPGMLTEAEREQLLRNMKETNAYVRAELARNPPKEQGPASPQSVANAIETRRERLQRGSKEAIAYIRTELAMQPKIDLENLPPAEEPK